MCFTLFGCLDGGTGLGHNLLIQFSTLSSSKMEISETNLFDILTIHNDHISHVNHVLDPLNVLFALLGGFWGGGGVFKEAGAQFVHAVFHPLQLKTGHFRN